MNKRVIKIVLCIIQLICIDETMLFGKYNSPKKGLQYEHSLLCSKLKFSRILLSYYLIIIRFTVFSESSKYLDVELNT